MFNRSPGFYHRNHTPSRQYHQGYRYYKMPMLWDQTKDLPKDTFEMVKNIYAEAGFPFQVRLHLAHFVESNFMTGDVPDNTQAIMLAEQLIMELDVKIESLSDPDRVLDKRTLQELSDNLRVRRY